MAQQAELEDWRGQCEAAETVIKNLEQELRKARMREEELLGLLKAAGVSATTRSAEEKEEQLREKVRYESNEAALKRT